MKKISMLLAVIVVSLCLVGNVAGVNPKKVIGANPGEVMGASSGEKWVLKKGEPFYLFNSDIRKIWMRGYIEQGDERKEQIEKGLQDGRIIKYKTDQIVEIGSVLSDGLRDIIEIEAKVITDKERMGWIVLRYFPRKVENAAGKSPIDKRYLKAGEPLFLFTEDLLLVKRSQRYGNFDSTGILTQRLYEDGRIIVYEKDMIVGIDKEPPSSLGAFDFLKVKVISDSGRTGVVFYLSLKRENDTKEPELREGKTKAQKSIILGVGGHPSDKWFLKADRPLFLFQKDVEEIEDKFEFGQDHAGQNLIWGLYETGRVKVYEGDQRVKFKRDIPTVSYEFVEVEVILDNGRAGWIRQKDLKRIGSTFKDFELREE